MPHSLVKVYVHFVWNTKYHERILLGDTRQRVKEHIQYYAEENGIALEALNVQPEHVHLLMWLGRDQKIEDIAKLLKGESSHWINHNDLVKQKFAWQTGYAAFSVSYQTLETVKSYIHGQDEHHRLKTFIEEYQDMLLKSGYSDTEISELLHLGNR